MVFYSMVLVKQIASLALAVLVLNQQFHIFESASMPQDNSYSVCAINCDQNEHSAGQLDCVICVNNIRSGFIIHNTDPSFSNINKFFIHYKSKIISNKSFVAFTSRAPPSILL